MGTFDERAADGAGHFVFPYTTDSLQGNAILVEKEASMWTKTNVKDKCKC